MDIRVEGTKAVLVDFAGASLKVQRAGLRATNRALTAARTLIVQRMTRDTGLKAKVLRDHIWIKPAVDRRPEGRIGTSLKRIPLIAFDASGPRPSRGRGTGVSYRAMGGGRTRVRDAFIANVRGPLPGGIVSGGHVGVFVRAKAVDHKSAGAWSKNLPIKQLFGPSLGHVFAKYRPEGLARAEEMFRKTFARELEFRNSAAGAAVSAGTD
jgi:hypothetical protein